MELKKIKERIKDAGVDTIRIEFADQHGVCRGKIIPARRLEEVMEEGINCAQPTFSLDLAYNIPPGTGTAEAVDYADMTIIPDPSTFTLVPYQERTARFIGDIYADGKPFPYSPRNLLKKVVGLYHDLGLEPIVATELEFFVFNLDNACSYYQDKPSCVYTTGPRVDPLDLMPTLQNTLLEMGLNVLYINHEFFQSQYEVNGRHTEALKMADETFTFKAVCKDVAFLKGLLLTFMGRPKDEMGGSGYHLHFSINDKATGKNLFDDPSAPDGIPELMRQFIAGQMAHSKGMTAFLAPTVNSYKRYVPDSFAPYFLAWGKDNRTTYIRIPRERGAATRVENRAGCASANPYFAIAVTLLAGLDGIRNKMALGQPYVGDIYGEDPTKFQTMPFYLHEAVGHLLEDKALCEAIGPEIIRNYSTMKLAEAERFRTHVSNWEFQEYSYHL